MAYRTRFVYFGFHPKMSQSATNKVFKQAYADLGLHFFANNLHRRFTISHGWKVGYTPRHPAYNDRKEKTLGHREPYVWTGETQSRAASLDFVGIFATATKGEGKSWLTVNAPALNYHPERRVEFERVGEYELPPLERFVEKRTEQYFIQSQETITTTV